MRTLNLNSIDKSPLDLVGTFVEIHWAIGNKMAARQCEKCVYLVRGAEGGMVCVELVYDAIEGVHKHDAIYWVPVSAVQVMRRLTETEAERRIARLETEAIHPDMPRD
ncbi:MAG: hypothetical protein SNJ74_06005 [Fimbriimonadaceae bacterium]